MNPDSIMLWNHERQQLHALLCDLHPTLGALYMQGIFLLSQDEPEQDIRARLSLVGHCFRELMNRLPDALRDVEGLPASLKGEEEAAVAALLRAFESHQGFTEGPRADDLQSGERLELITVPRAFVEAVSHFVSTHRDGTENGRIRDSVAVLGAIDTGDPALRPWVDARQHFMSMTHLSPDDVLALAETSPVGDEALTHIEAVEASLRVRLGGFFDNYAELEDLISKANETVRGDGETA